MLCSRCGQSKRPHDFGPMAVSKGGHQRGRQYYCRPCMREYEREKRTYRNAWMRRHRMMTALAQSLRELPKPEPLELSPAPAPSQSPSPTPRATLARCQPQTAPVSSGRSLSPTPALGR